MSKSIFKKLGGKIVKVSEMNLNSLYYSNRTVRNYEAFKGMYKAAKNDMSVKASLFVKGGLKDPARIAAEKAAYDKNLANEFIYKVTSRASKDEFSQAAAKKRANKMLGIFDGIEEAMLKKPSAESYSNREAVGIANRYNMSKREFFDLLDDQNKLKGSLRDDAGNIAEAESRGGLGRSGLMQAYQRLKRDGMRIFKEVKPQLPKASTADRMVNARGKGVVFRRINGRIVPIRPKKSG